MLIPFLGPRLSSNLFRSPHRTFTATSPSNHNQHSFPPRTPYSPLVSFRAQPLQPPPPSGHILSLGPATSHSHHTCLQYLHAANAMERVLPAPVRRQGRVIGPLVSLAADLAALCLLACPYGSKIGVGVTQSCFWNWPLARQAPTSPWSPHRAHFRHQVEHPHVYAGSCQDCCELGYLTSQRGDSHLKCVFAQSRDWEQVTNVFSVGGPVGELGNFRRHFFLDITRRLLGQPADKTPNDFRTGEPNLTVAIAVEEEAH